MAGVRYDPLFVGLTRPALLFGVSLQFAMINLLVVGIFFINLSSFKVVFVGAINHLIGYILCFKEPRFMEIYLKKFEKFNVCPNKSYYGANSYYV